MPGPGRAGEQTVGRSTVRLGGLDVAYLDVGAGERALVLLHGNSSSGGNWAAQIDGPLGRAFRLVVPDLPGHGASGRRTDPAGGYTLEMFASAVAAACAHAGVRRPVLVGHSLGAHVVLQGLAAGLLPDPAGVVIFGAAPLGKPLDLEGSYLPSPAFGLFFTAELDADARATWARAIFSPGFTVPAGWDVDLRATDPRVRADLAQVVADGAYLDETGLLASAAWPVAVLHGEHDALIDRSFLDGLDAPTLWRRAVQLVPGSGHCPHVETPDAFGELLRAFVEEACGGSGVTS